MQYNMNLPETGALDEATKKLMNSPRCGIKDERRGFTNKRFLIHGRQWEKNHLTWRFDILLIDLT